MRLRLPGGLTRCRANHVSQATVPRTRVPLGSWTTRPAPGRGHDGLVVISGRRGRLSGQQPADLRRGVPAHLQRGLGQLRELTAAGQPDVADGEDAVLPLHPEIWPGQDAAAASLRQAPAAGRCGSRDACHPDGDIAGQVLAASQHDRVGGDLADGGVQPDIDAAGEQLAQRVGVQRRMERREQAGGLLDEPDLDGGRVDLGKGGGQGDVTQLRDGAGQFDAGACRLR